MKRELPLNSGDHNCEKLSPYHTTFISGLDINPVSRFTPHECSPAP